MNRLKSDNSGFSLVEIIISVMIVSIISGIAGYGVSISSGKPAEQCAKKLSSTLSHARTTTMGKYRNEITLKNTGSSYTVNERIIVTLNDDGSEGQTNERGTTIGNANVTIEYSLTGTEPYTTLTAGNSITLRFDSGSGALKEPSDVSGQLIFRISKSGTVKYVTITQLTGNVTIS
jgi:prepilin-type N-terminal cleavage/methylation domain-containing protein